jgi:signal transduction histidine kinase
VLARAVAVLGGLYGLQALPFVVAQLPEMRPLWNALVVPAVLLSIAAAFTAAITRRLMRTTAIVVAVVYLFALQTWPLAVLHADRAVSENFWLFYMLAVAIAEAAIGFDLIVATTYCVVVPIIYGLIRLTPAGGGLPMMQAVLDAAYGIILGGIVVAVVTMLRHAAANVDSAQALALTRYSHAVRQHATEVERVQVDSIVHDSVLTTLLSAARADTPQAKVLAANMAENAIGHLREAALVAPDDGSTVTHAALAKRVTDAAGIIGGQFEIRLKHVEARPMPVLAADAVYSAAVQAMVNCLQHAGDREVNRWLSVRGLPNSAIEIEVGDTGAGFDLESVPKERLGLRVSILERIAGAGGVASIDTAPGEGTIVTILWPNPALHRDEWSG